MKAAGPAAGLRIGEVYHGGNLAAARSRFADAPRPWLDLSTGINPEAYPVGELSRDAWTRLPEPSAIGELEAVAARAYGARDADRLIAAPGAQALIGLLPRLLPASRVGILGMTYAEHEASWRALAHCVETVDEMAALEAFEVAIVVNPNNPDGRLTSPDALAELSARLAGKGGMLVVDEAFMDVETFEKSLVPKLPPAGAVVLRSFGKFYGLAGVRLGFAAASPALASRIRRALGPWAVSGAGDRDRPRGACRQGMARPCDRPARERGRAARRSCSGTRASRSSAARCFSGWRAGRKRRHGSSASGGKPSWCAPFPRPMPIGCASVCRAPRRSGAGSRRRLASESE